MDLRWSCCWHICPAPETPPDHLVNCHISAELLTKLSSLITYLSNHEERQEGHSTRKPISCIAVTAAYHAAAEWWGNPTVHVFLQHFWNAGPANTHVVWSIILLRIINLHGASGRKCLSELFFLQDLILCGSFKFLHSRIKNGRENECASWGT